MLELPWDYVTCFRRQRRSPGALSTNLPWMLSKTPGGFFVNLGYRVGVPKLQI